MATERPGLSFQLPLSLPLYHIRQGEKVPELGTPTPSPCETGSRCKRSTALGHSQENAALGLKGPDLGVSRSPTFTAAA